MVNREHAECACDALLPRALRRSAWLLRAFELRPHAIEFWEGRANRLHDREHFLREGDGWRSERLSP